MLEQAGTELNWLTLMANVISVKASGGKGIKWLHYELLLAISRLVVKRTYSVTEERGLTHEVKRPRRMCTPTNETEWVASQQENLSGATL